MNDPKPLEVKATMPDVVVLLGKLQQRLISVVDFCNLFENMWNFEIDKGLLSEESHRSLDVLFNEVVWFCSAPREQWDYPKYRDDPEVRQAASATLRSLTQESRDRPARNR